MKKNDIQTLVEMIQGCGIDSFEALLEKLHTADVSEDELEELGVGHDRLPSLERAAAKRTVRYWISRIEKGAQERHKRYMRYVADLIDEYGLRLEEFGVTLDYLDQCQHNVPMARYVVGIQFGHAYASRISGTKNVRETKHNPLQMTQAYA